MEYIFNAKTNCFEIYAEQYETKYETKIDEKTGEEITEETQVLIPCTERLYTRDEVNAFFAQCKNNKVLKSVNGIPTIVDLHTETELAIITKTNRIAELKAKLNATDYQAIKYAEGVMAYDEFAPVRAERQLWRDEINTLEAEIATLQ